MEHGGVTYGVWWYDIRSGDMIYALWRCDILSREV